MNQDKEKEPQTINKPLRNWRFRFIKNVIMPFSFIIVILFAWEAYGVVFGENRLLPPPSRIINAFVETRELLFFHAKYTLIEAAMGFLLAFLVSVFLALLIDHFKLLKQAIYPLLVISQTVPIVAIAPLFIVLFGFGILPKVIVVALMCFFPIVISMVEGLQAADKDMVDLLRVMDASNWQIFRLVRFPAALVSIFSGIKIAAAYSVMGAVIGEWVGARYGLGLFMILVQKSFRTDQMLAAIAVITAASLLLFGAMELLQRLLMPWYYSKGDSEDIFVDQKRERKVVNEEEG
ncbi:MAG TPA: ABC transporter permease [Clostridia bacterium]|jgi:ABC-type nitrate/sulfonate/bicarbonate transport system permease component|nr:ABC transporter permease [Clostridia bacterium]